MNKWMITKWNVDPCNDLPCIDSHIHVSMLGESQHYINLIDCYSLDALTSLLAQKSLDEPDLPFYVGFNWDQTKLGGLPTRELLDSVTAKPVRRDLIID